MENTQNKPIGKLFTSNPNGLKRLSINAELWQITRAGNDIPNAFIVRDLAPSTDLFKSYINEWKHLPPEAWWSLYEERFLKELKSKEKIGWLRLIYKKLVQGNNIVLICFCNDSCYCHRRLVGEFFKSYGIDAQELNPVLYRQLSIL